MKRFLKPGEFAKLNDLPVELVRQMCKRKVNPMPHIESGSKRPVVYIDADEGAKWLKEEMYAVR